MVGGTPTSSWWCWQLAQGFILFNENLIWKFRKIYQFKKRNSQIYTRKMIFLAFFWLKKTRTLGDSHSHLPQNGNNWTTTDPFSSKSCGKQINHKVCLYQVFLSSPFTGSLKTARKPKKKPKQNIPTNLWFTTFWNPHGKIPTKVCVCVRERENFVTKVCMVCMWDDKLGL
jgi:hypothetical protein